MQSLRSFVKKIDSYRLNGAALQMVIIMALIITIISSSLLLLAYYKRMNYLHFSKQEGMRRSLDNAVTLSLSKYFLGAVVTSGDVFASDSVAIKEESWGIYQLVNIKVYNNRDTLEKSYLVGRILDKPEEVLYVADEDRPLSISGDSKITGDAYLPKSGIRSAYVEGRFYKKDQPLVYGQQLTSTRTIPEIDLSGFKKIFSDLDQLKNQHGEALSAMHSNSFFFDAVVIHGKVLRIDEPYNGKFVFIADSLIEIGENAGLENVIVYAPVVRFLSGNKSNVQVFSRDSVILEERVSLRYPSTICMYREKAKKNEFSRIKLGKQTSFEGTILARGADENYLKYILEVGSESHLKGLVDVDGTFNYTTPASYESAIRAKRLVCKLKGLLYENYIIDLKLNVQNRPVSFLESSITEQKTSKKVLKWLE